MADTYTTNLNLTKPEPGAAEDTWGISLNSDLDTLDAIFSSSGTQVNLNPNQVNFADGKKAIFGTGSDLSIYHDGSHSYISENGTGNLILKGGGQILLKSPADENMIVATGNGAVGLYYDNVAKFQTTSTGVDVTGTTVTDALTVQTAQGDISINNSSSTLNFARAGASYIRATNSLGHFNFITGANNFTNKRLQIASNGDISFYDDTGATQALFWDASAESLGIGTTSVAERLTVSGNQNITGKLAIGISAAHPSFDFYNENTAYFNGAVTIDDNLYVTGGGSVGIGTSSPSETLHVMSGTNNDTVAIITGAQADRGLTISTFLTDGRNDGGVDFKAFKGISFTTDSSERARIDSSGNVGIGTSSPAKKLDVLGDIRSIDSSSNQHQLRPTQIISYGTDAILNAQSTGDDVRLNTQGTTRLIATAEGNVGIGTSSPSSLLHLSSSAPVLTVTSTSGTGGTHTIKATGINGDALQITAENDIYLNGDNIYFRKADETQHMRLTSTGNLGIGTTSPQTTLHANSGTADTVAIFQSSDQFADIKLQDSGGSSFIRQSNGSLVFEADRDNAVSGSALIFKIDGSNVGRFTSAGNFGIGTSSPDRKLTVSGTLGIGIDDYIVHNGDSNSFFGFNGLDSWKVRTGGGDRLVIGNDDSNFNTNLGIGISSLTEKFEVNGSINTSNQSSSFTTGNYRTFMDMINSSKIARIGTLKGANTPTGSQGSIYFTVNGTTEAVLDNNGALLVGKTVDSLSVAGATLNSGGTAGKVQFVRSGAEPLALNRLSNDGTIIDFRKAGTTVGTIATKDDNLYLGTGDTFVRFFDTDDAIAPVTSAGSTRDNAIDLGTSTRRFKDFHLSGTGYFGTSVGIGTSSPGEKLTVSGNTLTYGSTGNVGAGTSYFLGNSQNSRDIALTRVGSATLGIGYYSGGWQESARFDSSGNFLVGQTSQSPNTVGVSLNNNGNISAKRDGGIVALFNRATSDGEIISIRKDDVTVGSIRSYGGDLIMQTGITGLRFNDGSDAIHPVIANGSVSDNATDLGLTNARFKDLHLSGTANVGLLEVYHATTDTVANFESGDNSVAVNFTAADNSMQIATSGTDGIIKNNGAGSFRLFNNGSERARIDSIGRLGIGTSSPSTGMHLSFGDSKAELTLERTGTNASSWGLKPYNSDFFIRESSTDRITFKAGGNVGIGTTSPSNPLDVAGIIRSTSTNPQLRIHTSSGTGTGFLVFGDSADDDIGQINYAHGDNSMRFVVNASERARINSDGYLLVNKTSSGISTTGALLSDVGSHITRDGGSPLSLNRLTSDGAILDIRKDGTTVGSIFSSGGIQCGIGDGNTALLFADNISAVLPWSASSNSGKDDTIDLGRSATRFKDIYLGGNIILSGSSANEGYIYFPDSDIPTSTTFKLYHFNDTLFWNGESIDTTSTSDYRAKKDIQPLKDGLERVNKLNPVEFRYIKDDKYSEGFIAHELQEVWEHGVHGEKDGDIMQSVSYGRITPLLVKAIQEQQEQIESLKSEIAKLKGE